MAKSNKKFWNEFPVWIFIGTVIILSPIFSYTTIDSINRQKKNTETLLSEKGAALIRSFEAGTRTGLLASPGDTRQLQKLLYETAQQPDIEYLLVANTDGRIIAHSNYLYTGVMLNLLSHNKKLDLSKIAESNALYKQIITTPDGKSIFLMFRRFSPSGDPSHRSIITLFNNNIIPKGLMDSAEPDKVIVVALDMSSIEEMRRIHFRDTVITGVFLLLAGLTGVIFMFMIQGYRSTRTTLSRIRVFSETLVENMPVGLVALDSNHIIVSSNQVAKTILPEIRNGNGGLPVSALPEELTRELLRLGNDTDIIESEIECRTTEGQPLPLEISAAVLRDHDDELSGYICLFKDMTEEKALKKEVERSQRLASIGKLAAGVAHEVRNPLSSIKGFATYFKERYKTIPEDQEISDIMIKEVDRLNRVVGQLLEFARPVAVSLQPIEIEPFINNSIKLVELTANKHGVDINTAISTSVTQFPFDPDKISQVLLNLYLNAIDAMEHGGELNVSVTGPGLNRRLNIQVCDTGTGIDKNDLAHIFDPYFTTKSSGTGLGLAISHNIIEAHNGEISIESIPGKGTIITISLPGAETQKDMAYHD